MRHATTALLALLAAAPAGGAELDASAALPPPPGREACRLGPCPAFGATSLLSAAIRRRHGLIRGESVELSDADFFLRRVLADRRVLARAAAALSADGRPEEPGRLEARWPKADLEYLLERGAATRRTLPWDRLWRRYEDENERVRAEAEARYAECLGRARGSAALEGMPACPAPLGAGRDRASAFLEGLRREDAERARLPETGEAALLRQEREWTRALMRGFRLKDESFFLNAAVLGPRVYDDAEACRGRGEGAKAFVLAELAAGRPVLLGLNVQGLREWRGGEGADWRPVLVSGAAVDDGGAAELRTRLPDGKEGPWVPEALLCRVGQAVSVLAEGER